MDKNDKEITIKLYELLSNGYGIIPTEVMTDKHLTVEAKAIYAYLCSYTGSGSNDFFAVSIMVNNLGISENEYYESIKTLEENGYIETY